MCSLPFAVEPPEPKEARAAATRWYPAKGEPSDASEVLFLALLVNQVAIDTHQILNCTTWASDVTKHLNSDGTVPNSTEWRMTRAKPGSMIAPVYDAHQSARRCP